MSPFLRISLAYAFLRCPFWGPLGRFSLGGCGFSGRAVTERRILYSFTAQVFSVLTLFCLPFRWYIFPVGFVSRICIFSLSVSRCAEEVSGCGCFLGMGFFTYVSQAHLLGMFNFFAYVGFWELLACYMGGRSALLLVPVLCYMRREMFR